MARTFDTTLPFQRGETLYSGAPEDANLVTDNQLGEEYISPDTENNTARAVILKAVQNDSGGILASVGGRPVKFKDGEFGLKVDGFASSIADANFAGWADDVYGTKDIASGDVFFIVTEGPIARDGQTDQARPSIHEFIGRDTALTKVYDDFTHYNSGDAFTTLATDSGPVTVGDTANGVLDIAASDGSVADNDETYVHGTNEIFLFAANKPIVFEALVALTEANVDDANVIVGFLGAVAANTLLDDGGGPPASYDGAVFFKVDGGTVWQAEVSTGATQVIDTSAGAFPGDGTFQVLRIEWIPTSATSATVKFFVDGIEVASLTQTYTGGTEMQTVLGVKNGGANLETINVDNVLAAQLR